MGRGQHRGRGRPAARELVTGGLAGLGLLALAACGGFDTARRAPPAVVAEAPQATPAGGGTIGTGATKIALILPLTGQGASVGAALRNAAELAVADFQQPDLTILVKDDGGTPDGARAAAAAALEEGAELVVGPLFAATVQAAAQTARSASKPMIAFSTDAGVASRGVYLLSFLPQAEVDRVVDEATAQGRRSFAALIPESTYGNVVEAQFREAAARRGGRVVAVERYAASASAAAVARIAPLVTGPGATADALFIPDTPDGLAAVAGALTRAGFSPGRVRPIGTSVWNDPRSLALPALQGGWFAGVDNAGFAGFAGRYRARFRSEPARIASLSYDAVSLAAALTRQYGSQRFAETTLTNPSGFAGTDGTFRFRPEGTSDRALAVYEIRNGAAAVVSPAPRTLGNSGT